MSEIIELLSLFVAILVGGALSIVLPMGPVSCIAVFGVGIIMGSIGSRLASKHRERQTIERFRMETRALLADKEKCPPSA